MSVAVSEHLSFGPFRLSVRQRALTTADGPVLLSSRAFDVLLTLIDRRDTVVTKDELMRRVWANIVVEENNLHVQIAAVRRALGAHHGCIMTVPGKGYRFIGDLTEDGGPQLPPAPVPAWPEAPSNLPAELNAMVGRAAELAATVALLRNARLVTLVGPGGVGKTRLALAAARAATPNFPGGSWLVELGQVADAALVPESLAASLRIEELQGRTLADSTTMALRQRDMLLLIDGCEHVGAAVAELAGRLLQNCPHLRILCTSQAPLGLDGENIRRIAPLAVPDDSVTTAAAALGYDAVRLFVERAAAGDDRFTLNDATVGSAIKICRSLDGIPLAIELAAARVALLGLEPVRLRIASRLVQLGDESGTADRHRALRAAIEWSYGLLPETDRQILRRLSVFAGGFTLAAAREVAAGAGFGDADIERGVENLVRRSLLTNGPDLLRPRHRMLEVMRNFGLHALEQAGEQNEAARRHAGYFCRFASEAEVLWESSEAAEWAGPVAAELENLRAALAWALSPTGDAALAARLAAATARIWFEGSHLREGCGWLTRALAAAPAGLETRTLIRLKRGLAELCTDQEAAVTSAREAMALAATQNDPEMEGSCARALTAALIALGRYQEAGEVAPRAFNLLRDAGCARTFARCLGDLSILRGCAGDHAEARRYNIEAQARLKALGDDGCAAVCLQHAAEFEFAAGNAAAAAELAAESAGLFRALNRRLDLEISLGNLAAYRLAEGDAAGARQAAREALALAQQIEDELGVIIAIEHLSVVAAGGGGPDTAARLLGYVEEARRVLGQDRQQTEAMIHEQLLATLNPALTPDRRDRLTAEGRLLSRKAAILEAQRI